MKNISYWSLYGRLMCVQYNLDEALRCHDIGRLSKLIERKYNLLKLLHKKGNKITI
jgi:hypothetical protein